MSITATTWCFRWYSPPQLRRHAWTPEPLEVDRVLEMPLEMLLRPDHCTNPLRSRQILRDQQPVGSFEFKSIAYRLEDHLVWGITGMLLSQLAQMIGGPATADSVPHRL